MDQPVSNDQWRPLAPYLSKILGLGETVDGTALPLPDALGMVGRVVGGDPDTRLELWDLEGQVVEVQKGPGCWRYRRTGAWCDTWGTYHGLTCRACGEDVEHPAPLHGEGYALGPFHPGCAAQVERELLAKATDSPNIEEAPKCNR